MNQHISLAFVLQCLKRNWVLSTITFVSLFAIVVAIFIFYPRSYASEGKLFVQLGRESVSLDPTVTTTGTISLNESRETEIRSIVELLESRELLSKVVDAVGRKFAKSPQDDVTLVGSEKILESSFELPPQVKSFVASLTSGSSSNDLGMSDRELEKQQLLDKAIRALGDSIRIDSAKKTTVVSVYAKSLSPTLSQSITQSLMEAYKSKHLDVNRRAKSQQFFNTEFESQVKKVDQKVNELREYRNKNKFLSIVGASNLLQQKIDKLEIGVLDTAAQIAESNAKIESLQETLEALPDSIKTKRTTGIEKRSTDLMRDRLFALEVQETKLSADLDGNHPRVVAIRKAIKEARETWEKMPEQSTQNTLDANPTYLTLQATLLNEKATNEGLKNRQKSFNERLASAENDLNELNANEVMVDKMQLAISFEKATLDKLGAKRSEAQVIDRLDEESISNVVIAQPATLELKHVSPRGSIFLPLGALLSLFLTSVVALRANSRFREKVRVSEIEEQTEIPVLMTLPRVMPSQALLQ